MALIRTRREPPMPSLLSPVWPGEEMAQGLRRLWEALDRPQLTSPLGFVPPTEVKETKQAFIVSVELPGMMVENVDVLFENGVLTVHGEKVEAKEAPEMEADVRCYLFERSYGSFTRSFTVPGTIDPARIVADFQHGVLTITLPKVAEAKGNGARIKINAKK
jgi:HSP20 family protein